MNDLSYLMGAERIRNAELCGLGIEIKAIKSNGDRTLVIPHAALLRYIELIKAKLTEGFWNEIVGEEEIIFIFKFKDGSVQEFVLSPENEKAINDLCVEFNDEPPDLRPNVYKYISHNDFYHDFMLVHYADLVNRNL